MAITPELDATETVTLSITGDSGVFEGNIGIAP